MTAGTLALAAKPFGHSSEHLRAELERIDLMIRGRVARLRRIQSEDEHFRGLYISEQEVDALLAGPAGAPAWLYSGGEPDDVMSLGMRRLTEAIAKRRQASIDRGIDLRLDRLARIFGLDGFEIDVLLVCLAPEIELRYERLFAYLQDDVTKKRPSVDLVTRLLARDSHDLLATRSHFLASSPLLAHRLVHIVEDPQQPLSSLPARVLKVDDRIAEFLFGIDDVDARIRDCVTAVAAPRGLVDLLLEHDVRERFRNLASIGQDGESGASPVVILQGGAGTGKRSVAEALCRERNRALLIVDVAAIGFDVDSAGTTVPRRWTEVAELIEREASLRDAGVYWHGSDIAAEDQRSVASTALARAIDAGRGPCFIAMTDGVRAVAMFPRRGSMVLPMPEPSHPQRIARWKQALAGTKIEAAVDLDALASRFRLGMGGIGQAAATARRLAIAGGGENNPINGEHLQAACRQHSNQKLASLAHKVATCYRWDDIVLPTECMAQLRAICDHVKYREQVFGEWGFGRKLALGKGLAALFAGPSGTGKTMAASIIAAELGLDLYRIDLSTVISKYIGETEKNLSRVFDEAETSNSVLFFDEADALFGKRSEVRDSHDRYANVEVGYLLQRMEDYQGIAILATNLRKNMDDAFERRLRFTVEFPFPDEQDRHRIWERIWPEETPRENGLDLRLLASRYEMAGGSIKNVAVAAAFLAAGDGQVVRMGHIVQATQREYQKIGKLIVSDEFGAMDFLAQR
jgi:AAA+ superfamily predicted ATPase